MSRLVVQLGGVLICGLAAVACMAWQMKSSPFFQQAFGMPSNATAVTLSCPNATGAPDGHQQRHRAPASPPPRRDRFPADAPPFVSGPDCPRYLMQDHHPDAGIGHLFGGVLFAARTAQELGAALVLEEGHWAGKDHKHGSFPFFRRLFGLYPFLSQSEFQGLKMKLDFVSRDVVMSHKGQFYRAFRDNATRWCNWWVRVDTSSDFCDGQWCFQAWPGAYEGMAPLFKRLYAAAAGRVPPALDAFRDYAFSKSRRRVAWHLRASDISLHSGDRAFFSNVLDHLDRAAASAGVKLRHFVFHGDHDRFGGDGPPTGFEFLKELLPKAHYVSTASAETDMHSLTRADVLVGTGSSFAQTAATIAPERLIFLEHPPKENHAVGTPNWWTYHLNSSIVINYSGRMSDEMQERLNSRLAEQDFG